ncbi:MAG: NAD(P)-binding protein [Methylibium sp.]|uniref:NAD(P)-binding protein n=1 Tax=Methylibium sp. TaxID=2067992 RepID=UPI0017F37B5D|nr:NAD(P)-binding protein [Methylibium sp.]MBA3597756.1 NAD(P)-binding protein [Methylibium sp.]
MSEPVLEADYVIVGAGAVGMAFADTLLSSSEASMIVIDRRARPGGHWNDAYPFIRLHAPSAGYGVNSLALDSGRIDRSGWNEGFHELASGPEICAYFDRVMHERLLASGRVAYLPSSELGADGVVRCRLGGARKRVRALKKTVDCTFADTRLPATDPPRFALGAGVRCVTPGELPAMSEPCDGVVIIGAGKTAMDTALWLLEQGVDAEAITWIRPRDAWLLNRANVQPGFEFFARTIGGFAAEMEAARDASSIDDLFARLEAGALLQRIDTAIAPTMYRCAIVSDAELAQLRRITRVVRLGHVKVIEPGRIVLEQGTVATSERHLHVHCSADGIPSRLPQPMFQGERIVPQYVRRCSPTFSAALVAHLEATMTDDAEKNAMCTPVPPPCVPRDWLRMQVDEARNNAMWSKSAELRAWLAGARLNLFSPLIARAVQEPDPVNTAILDRYRTAVKPGLARLSSLLAGAE